MNCVEFEEQVALLMDGIASSTLERALKAHVSACRSCSTRLKEMQDVRTLLRKSVIPAPSDALDARVMRGFQNRTTSFAASQPWWRGGIFDSFPVPKPALALSLAAVFVALLAGIVIGRMSVTGRMAPPPPPTAFTAVPVSSEPKHEKPSEDPMLPRQPRPLLASEIHRPSSRKGAKTVMARTKPLESLTVVSPSGANYTTTATLDGFEPVTGARLRVIRGGDER